MRAFQAFLSEKGFFICAKPYLDNSGYSQAAASFKQGLSLL
jgi:hypothetical protein